MIKVKDGIATRDPLPEFLEGLHQSSLYDLSWTDPALGVQDCAWWPEENQSPPIDEDQEYGAETLTLDTGRKVVIVKQAIIPRVDPETLLRLRVSLMARIDDLVAERITRSTRFAMGYEQREAAARAYKDSGYQLEPTEWVSRFARNVGLSDKDAADLILIQAAGLRNALAELDGLRMDKYLVASQTTFKGVRAKAAQILAAVEAVVIP